jgi:uncharacterized protein YjbJ (UPF0337 family)
MNRDQVKGRWEQIKGSAKQLWGNLTDDDFQRADGSADKLYGIIQERFGDTKEAIKAKLDRLDRNARRDASEARDLRDRLDNLDDYDTN